jgi:hypothetical protein
MIGFFVRVDSNQTDPVATTPGSDTITHIALHYMCKPRTRPYSVKFNELKKPRKTESMQLEFT